MLVRVLRGRATECAQLDELLAAAREGRSGALVLRGEAGIGKTALVDYVAAAADGARVLRAEGVEAEVELPFAALHQLCMPLLEHVERLPEPQAEGLRTAFGLSSGSRPDPFLVGLAVLTLFSDAAETPPLVCLVDDAQWLDHSSAQVLAFVARRLDAEGVFILFAERDSDEPGELAGLPELRVERLSYTDARELLASVNLGVLDERVRDRIIEETRGNPLALLELPRAYSLEASAGGFAVPDGTPLQGRIEAGFRSRVAELPDGTQRLLLLVAAEPLGDPALLWRAGASLGLGPDAAVPAESADLFAIGTRAVFRHPLLRSAIYDAARPEDRRTVHAALADATDPALDPDRRAWHRAHATLALDEDVAVELEQSAERARTRGGLAAAAAFLERSAELTPDPQTRTQRTLAAAERKRLAGLHEDARALLATAQQGPLTDLERGVALRLQGLLDWEDSSAGSSAASVLVEAARQLEPLDVALARDTHLEAMLVASNMGRLGDGVVAVAEAAREAPRAPEPRDTSDLLVDGLAVFFTDGYPAGAPLLKQALAKARDEGDRSEHALRAIRVAARVAAELFDEQSWAALVDHHVQVAREDGILVALPVTLTYKAAIRIHGGDLEGAGFVLDECEAISTSTTRSLVEPMRLLLVAYRGDEAEAARLGRSLERLAAERGEGLLLSLGDYAHAILHNSLGQYDAALAVAQRALAPNDLTASSWVLPELVEAAARGGHPDVASAAFGHLVERTQAADTTFARGVEARTRALVSDDDVAEDAYREALDAVGETSMRMFHARAQLLYGEWLRRANRRVDARAQLEAGHEFFERVGADGFAGRAARELLATGATPRKRTDDARAQLTAQEAQIAVLARDGHTNPEIGSQLFLSPRTVEWHLRHVFMKLGIRSRRQLRTALAA
jgi:DNA-binding CsgD family transcriptional regulator/tetratricopeptide (TPR) repeat protein